jgi:hypothetical protein
VVHVVAGDQEGLDLEGELGRITRAEVAQLDGLGDEALRASQPGGDGRGDLVADRLTSVSYLSSMLRSR